MRRLAVLLLLVAACTKGSTPDAVVLDEFSISLPDIDASTYELSVRNEGEFTHTLVVSDGQGSVVFATGAIEAGETATVPVDFDPGTYQFSCRIVVGTDDGGISDHFELGMVADIELGT